MNRITVAIVLIIGAVLIGAGAYQAGFTAALGAGGQAAPGVVPYAFVPFGFGFGFLGLLFTLLFIFLLFGALRGIMWGGPRHWGGPGNWRGGPRTMFEEWHREAHGESPGQPQGRGPSSSV